MKSLAFVLLFAVASSSYAQNIPRPPSYPPTTLTSESEDLARGFAAAFEAIRRTPVYLTYERAGKIWTISSVRSVRAQHGVLVVETDNRLVYILNPRDIIGITDAPPQS